MVDAGWQPDPSGRYRLRYWDGTTWTGHVADGSGAAQLDPEWASATGRPREEPEKRAWRPRRANTVRAVIVGAIVAITVTGYIVRSTTGGDSTSAARVADVPYVHETACPGKQLHVEYFVTGNARSVDLTITQPSGVSQQNNVAVPLLSRDGTTQGLSMCMDPTAFVSILAQSNDSGGTVGCEMRLDGGRVARNSSGGAYAIVSCSTR